MKKIYYLFSIALMVGMLCSLCSCTKDAEESLVEKETAGWHSAKLKSNINIVAFDEGGRTRAAATRQWQDGDVIYLLLYDKDGKKVQAYIKYNGSTNSWDEVMYEGYKSALTCTTERAAEAYFIEGAKDLQKDNLPIRETNAIYTCSFAKYVYPADGELTINIYLTPLTSRVRFKGKSGTKATIWDLKIYNRFCRSTGEFSAASKTYKIEYYYHPSWYDHVETEVASDGFSPYIYCEFADPKEPSLTIITDNTYKASFESSTEMLAIGSSGSMILPTIDNHSGWTTVIPDTKMTLSKSSISLGKGENSILTATVSPASIKQRVRWTSSNTSIATVDENGTVTGVDYGRATITATSLYDSSIKDTCEIRVVTMENGHEYVDLGLPSGTLWATCDIGATYPFVYGQSFAWGEITPATSTSTYTYSDNPGTLPLNRDAAQANWGGRWRMPTKEEFDELLNECARESVYYDGHQDYERFSSKTNNNYIILSDLIYWTSSLNTSDNSSAYYVNLFEGSCSQEELLYMGYRFYGHKIRPVLRK